MASKMNYSNKPRMNDNSLCASNNDVDLEQLRKELIALGTKPGPITATTKQVYIKQLHRLRNGNSIPVQTPPKVDFARCTASNDDDDSEQIRKELVALGQRPGPITPTTRAVYERQLQKLRKEKYCTVTPERFPRKVELSQSCPEPENYTKVAADLDRSFVTHFTSPQQGLRKGLASKTSFNYLLLDPRIMRNIPFDESQDHASSFRRFVSSIFYVGKGKQARPHRHLYEAAQKLRREELNYFESNKKARRIREIWEDDDQGIVSLHVFQNSLPDEALCREAAMMEAIGTANLTNANRGSYKGICTNWIDLERRLWGSHLL